MGHKVAGHDGFLEIEQGPGDVPVETALEEISSAPVDPGLPILPGIEQCMSEKYHRFLSSDLLYEDAVAQAWSTYLQCPELAAEIMAPHNGN